MSQPTQRKINGLNRRTMGMAAILCLAWFVSPARAQAVFDTGRFGAERRTLASDAMRRAYPHLGSDYEVLGPSKSGFNCFAHTLGIHSRWVYARLGPVAHPYREMDLIYQGHGYRRIGLDYRWIRGQQKVALYATQRADGSIVRFTHAAIQRADGTWESKLGNLALIRHRTPNALVGPDYGVPVAVYVRP